MSDHSDEASKPMQAEAACIPKELDVRTILLEVTPGDGDGFEVFAKNVSDVERHMGKMGEELEDWQLGIRRFATQPPAIPAAPAVQASGEREEGARIWIDQSETTPIQVVGKLLRSIPDEYLVTAERDNEDDDWYIRVTNSGGYKDYDGYWSESARKSADEVMLEAARGAMVPLASDPLPHAVGKPLSEQQPMSDWRAEKMAGDWIAGPDTGPVDLIRQVENFHGIVTKEHS